MEAKLLEIETVDWLERNEIDRVLSERNLAASFDVTAAQQRMAMGQLLRADLLVIMRSQEIPVHGDRDQSTKAVRIDLVVAETTMGLRLAARSMASFGNLESDAANLVAVIQKAIAKHGESVRDLYAVPPFMCHDPGYAKDHLMAVYAEWIERYLAVQPGVLVVEMAEAEAIAREYELASPADRVRRPLPVYVLGEFRHQGHGDSRRVAISVRLKRGQAAIAEISAEVSPADAPAWLQDTAMKVLRQSGKSTPARMDIEAELRDAVRRSRDYLAFGDLREAHAMAELAVLLAPDRAEARELAIRTAIRLVGGLTMLDPGSPAEMLRLRRRALQHIFQASEAGSTGKLPPEVFGIALASIQPMDSLRDVPRELIPDLLEYRREVRRKAFELVRQFAEAGDWRRSEACLFGALAHTPLDEAIDEKITFLAKYQDRMDQEFKTRLFFASPTEDARLFWDKTLALENLDPEVEKISRKNQAVAAPSKACESGRPRAEITWEISSIIHRACCESDSAPGDVTLPRSAVTVRWSSGRSPDGNSYGVCRAARRTLPRSLSRGTTRYWLCGVIRDREAGRATFASGVRRTGRRLARSMSAINWIGCRYLRTTQRSCSALRGRPAMLVSRSRQNRPSTTAGFAGVPHRSACAVSCPAGRRCVSSQQAAP